MADNKLEGIDVKNPLVLDNDWLATVQEDIVDPDRPIIDTHHHLWPAGGLIEYSLEDLHADTGSGHNVVKTVFMECHASYHEDGPEHLRSWVKWSTYWIMRNAQKVPARPKSPPW